MLLAVIGLRGTDVVQLLVALPSGLGRSTRPVLDLAVTVLYLVESLVLTVVVVRRRRYDGVVWPTIDLATGLTVLALTPLFTSDQDRIGTWTAWGFGICVGIAFGVGLAYPRRWQAIGAALALAAVYLAASLPAALATGRLSSTVAANAAGFLGFALFPRAVGTFLRRLGRDADAARAAAETAGEIAERDRQRRMLHDHETVLRMLAQPVLDPALAELLRRQAVTGANRVRTFLDRPDPESVGPAPTLATINGGTRASSSRGEDIPSLLRRICTDFGDLPVQLTTDLAAGVYLDARTTDAVADAVTTLLHNVRRHAGASSVIVHADSVDARWEITVRDDGCGFDPAVTPFGFGLRSQVIEHLAHHDVQVDLRSAPGDGTVAALRGAITVVPRAG